MKRIVVWTVLIAAFGLAALAAEKASPAFQGAMKEIGGTLGKVAKDAAANDYEALVADAAVFKRNLSGPVGKYFTDTKKEDGLKMCTDSYNAADGLEKAAKAKDAAAVAEARKTLQGTCAACHKAYRIELPDKTYEIR
jgi:cytochrome c556